MATAIADATWLAEAADKLAHAAQNAHLQSLLERALAENVELGELYERERQNAQRNFLAPSPRRTERVKAER